MSKPQHYTIRTPKSSSITHRNHMVTVLNAITSKKSDTYRKSLVKEKHNTKLRLNNSVSYENGNYYKDLKVVHEIFRTQMKRFEPQNASISSRIDMIARKSDMFLQQPYEFDKENSIRLKKHLTTTRNGYSIKTSDTKTSFHKPSKSYTANIYFRTSQNFWMKQFKRVKNDYKTKLCKDIDALISDCKEAESLIPAISVNRKIAYDKKSKNVRWAIKEYITNISSNDWQSKKNIDFLMNLKNRKQISKRELFDSEMINRMVANMSKRALVIPTLGKKRIWKPQRYIPSRKVILANSIEELNYLYQIESHN